jgi:hypothetical protein
MPATIWSRIFFLSFCWLKTYRIRYPEKPVLPVLCGYKIWSLSLAEEHRLRLFENMVLRKVFGSKRDDVAWDQKRLYVEELLDQHSSPNIIWVIKS